MVEAHQVVRQVGAPLQQLHLVGLIADGGVHVPEDDTPGVDTLGHQGIEHLDPLEAPGMQVDRYG